MQGQIVVNFFVQFTGVHECKIGCAYKEMSRTLHTYYLAGETTDRLSWH